MYFVNCSAMETPFLSTLSPTKSFILSKISSWDFIFKFLKDFCIVSGLVNPWIDDIP